MKTQEEIEAMANDFVSLAFNKQDLYDGFINGYFQCQQDMADKKYSKEDIQNVLDGFTNEAPGFYIKTNFIDLLNKKD